MESKSRYKSSLAFTDLLFNILIGFAFMFIIAFLLINPVQKDADIEAKAEFMIIMSWDDQSAYDIDLWMQDPVGNIVGFPNMHAGLLHLDKDDLGKSNDSVTMRDGTVKQIYLNREVTTKIIKLNPYREVHTGIVILPRRGSEETVIRFTIDREGHVKSTNKRQKKFAGKRVPTGINPGLGNTPMNADPEGEGEQIGTRRNNVSVPADDDEIHRNDGL